MSKSFIPAVETLGLTTFRLCVPLSLPIREIASIADETFEPFTTKTDITRDML
jgi:hypothetical protein